MPALAALLGRGIWWPVRPGRGAGHRQPQPPYRVHEPEPDSRQLTYGS
ncbi:hypothetical protein [Kitasatospora sp. MAP5-34]|nr:hypothetical protein [Kitasatospora sp. MAP5-34]MDH6574520.1 hypothetical protein [Kitasatospora sp. MAP5-34]